MPQIVLASSSPRRAELLSQIGISFSVKPSHIHEERRVDELPDAYVKRLALEKAMAVQERDAITLGSDTTVVLNGQTLEKPRDRSDALRMLTLLQDQRHTVLTAVAVCNGRHSDALLATAEVQLRSISQAELESYCDTNEPFDKAGAYGIQGIGGIFIAGICGQPSTVAGLPLVETNALLERFGVEVWKNRVVTRHGRNDNAGSGTTM